MSKNKKEIISYASSFVSFVLPYIEINEAILFGSVARYEENKKSDIDIFFDVKIDEEKVEKKIRELLIKFYKTKIYESFRLKGIDLPISIKVGNIDNWELKRSIISDGIVLYGKYKEVPKNLKFFTYFYVKPIKDVARRNKIIRILFGRNEKKYSALGIISDYKGKKLSSSSFVVPSEKSREIAQILNKEKVSFDLFELWSDNL